MLPLPAALSAARVGAKLLRRLLGTCLVPGLAKHISVGGHCIIDTPLFFQGPRPLRNCSQPIHLVAPRSRSPAIPGRPAQHCSWYRDVPIGQVMMCRTVSDDLDCDRLCVTVGQIGSTHGVDVASTLHHIKSFCPPHCTLRINILQPFTVEKKKECNEQPESLSQIRQLFSTLFLPPVPLQLSAC